MRLTHRVEEGARLGTLLWEFGPGWRMISSAMLGGGIGPREWVLNAQVPADYARMDPIDHLVELAPPGPGVGMLTAAVVDRFVRRDEAGVTAVATVGLRVPTWAASPEHTPDPELAPRDPTLGAPALRGLTPHDTTPHDLTPNAACPPPGTINIIVAVPAAMTDAALVNTVMTVTEAKTQALIECGFPGSGTASDAVCVAVPEAGPQELFGGPRSQWGARIARAVHACVQQGAKDWGLPGPG